MWQTTVCVKLKLRRDIVNQWTLILFYPYTHVLERTNTNMVPHFINTNVRYWYWVSIASCKYVWIFDLLQKGFSYKITKHTRSTNHIITYALTNSQLCLAWCKSYFIHTMYHICIMFYHWHLYCMLQSYCLDVYRSALLI